MSLLDSGESRRDCDVRGIIDGAVAVRTHSQLVDSNVAERNQSVCQKDEWFYSYFCACDTLLMDRRDLGVF
jgi:hypothetical protein